jgi:hypothetical protein
MHFYNGTPVNFENSILGISLPVAPVSSRRRSASFASPCGHNEIEPRYGHTPNKDALHRTAEDLLLDSHPDSRTILPPAEPGCVESAGAEGEQLGSVAGATLIHRAATALMGIDRALSFGRAGDRTRESVGQDEAGVAPVTPLRTAFVRFITGSGRATSWCDTSLDYSAHCRTIGTGLYGWHRGLPCTVHCGHDFFAYPLLYHFTFSHPSVDNGGGQRTLRFTPPPAFVLYGSS